MFTMFRRAAIVFLALTVITGLIYPLVITAVAHLLFPRQATGSVVHAHDKDVGSLLMGQPFSGPGYFWARPSATAPVEYNGGGSGGSNLGPTNPTLSEAVAARIKHLKESNPLQVAPIPIDLVTTSASGLDPHISPAAAEWQIPRVAATRNISEARLLDLVHKHTEPRSLGLLGELRVNVLALNLDLDQERPTANTPTGDK